MEYIEERTGYVSACKLPFVVSPACDSTPIRVRFGQLQHLVYPHARYAVKGDDERWRLVEHNEYRKLKPGAPLGRYGVLDLLGLSITMTWMGPSFAIDGVRAFLPPTFLERSNASCLFAACNKQVPPLSVSKVGKIAKETKNACGPKVQMIAVQTGGSGRRHFAVYRIIVSVLATDALLTSAIG